MTLYLEPPAGTTVYIPFASYNSTGASVTLTGLATSDILIYKNGSVTQRSSTAGFTLLDTDGIDFDGVTGLHGFSIDLNDNTDAGFYAVGSVYWVVVSTVTIDSQTVTFIAAVLRIRPAESVTGKPKVDVDAFGGTAGTFASGRPEVNTTHAAGTAWNSGAIGATTLAADTITAAKVADGTIDAATFAASAITATAIAADAITAAKIADGAIDAATFAASAITATAIASNAITSAKIAADAIGATQIADGAIDAATFATGAITATAIAADAIGASELAADAVAEIAAAVWDLDATGHQTTGTFGQAIGDPAANTATIYAAVVTNAAGTDVAADIIAIKAETASILTDTAEIGAAGAGLTNINLPDQTMNITGDITGNLSGSVGSVTGAVGSVTGNVGGNLTGSIGSLAVQAKADVNAEADTALADYDGPTHAELTTLIGTPADTDVSTDIANVQATVDGITAGSGLDAAGVRAAIGLASANLDTQLDALPTNAELTTALAGLNDISVSDILTTQMTESYAANGIAPTVAQALFAVQQFLMDKDISGTNYTVRKLDGSTTAFVATLNDAVAPTASTRT